MHRNIFTVSLASASLLLLWQVLVVFFAPPAFLLPSPWSVLSEFTSNSSLYGHHALVTLISTAVGFMLALIIGGSLAITVSLSEKAEQILWPYVVLLKTIPTIALAPLLILLAGIGFLTKLIIVTLICFFPIFISTLQGLKSATQEQRDVFTTYGFSRLQTYKKLLLPNALPFIFPALKVSILLALTGSFVAEFIVSQAGLGYLLVFSLRTFDAAPLYVALLLTSAIGTLLFAMVSYLEQKIVFWSAK